MIRSPFPLKKILQKRRYLKQKTVLGSFPDVRKTVDANERTLRLLLMFLPKTEETSKTLKSHRSARKSCTRTEGRSEQTGAPELRTQRTGPPPAPHRRPLCLGSRGRRTRKRAARPSASWTERRLVQFQRSWPFIGLFV